MPVLLAYSDAVGVPIEWARAGYLLREKQAGRIPVTGGGTQQCVHFVWDAPHGRQEVWHKEILYSGLPNEAQAGIQPLQLVNLVLGIHSQDEALSRGWLTNTSPQWSSTTALSAKGTI